jgi:uncharacterized damage-inducible protein DinB
MQTDTVKILTAYNKAANAKMNEIIKNLVTEEWGKGLGGFFPSIRSLCSHIYIADVTWLRRFAGAGDFAGLKDPLLDKAYSFKETLFPTVETYLDLRPKLDDLFVGFAKGLSDGDLAKNLEYSSSGGDTFVKNFGGCLLHLFNHETHHRGMISLYLELLGYANDFNSLSAVL